MTNIYQHKTTYGFWIYLLSDCLLFGTLFATYAVLRGNTYGGPGAAELFDLSSVLLQTLILLASSFTAGIALIAAHNKRVDETIVWLGLTLILGLSFIGLEVNEFKTLIAEGNSWQRSGFLSAFFTLVGTHGAHVLAGSLWAIVLMLQIAERGFTTATTDRLIRWNMFWHFLDIVWIFVFTFVYLFGIAL